VFAKGGGGGTTATVCDGYPQEDAVQSQLQALAEAHPNLAQVHSIATLPSGREIWVMQISDNLDSNEPEPDEPAVAYTATMHGNEPDGVTLSLGLIEELLGGYGINDRATELVDNTDIWIMPLMNPDGLANCTRANAQGFDLNRSFPDLSADLSQATNALSSPLTSIQLAAIAVNTPETAAVMRWSSEHNFVLAADFHQNGGYAVVNYPYDKMAGVASGNYAKSPDDDLFKYISKVYSSQNHQMWDAASKKGLYGVPFLNSSGKRVSALTVNSTYPYGITNGSDWFAAGGTLQDWQYRYGGTNAVTVEVRDDGHFPTADELWTANRDSMLAYLQTVHVGTKGMVVDASNRHPIAASIAITGMGTEPNNGPSITVNQHFVFSDADDGSFFRMLRPGNYPELSITVTAPGYEPKSFTRAVFIADPNNSTVPPAALPGLPSLFDLETIELTRSTAPTAPLAAVFASAPDVATSGTATTEGGTAPATSRSTSPATLPTTLDNGTSGTHVATRSTVSAKRAATLASNSKLAAAHHSFARAADLVWANPAGLDSI